MTKKVNQRRAICKQLTLPTLFAGLVLLFSTNVQAKIEMTPSRAITERGTKTSAEALSQFPGGMKKFREYITSTTQHSGIPGTVQIKFRVEKNGDVVIPATWYNVYKQNEMNLRKAIASSPNWTPAVKNGRHTPSNYVLTVSFTNNNNSNRVRVDKIAVVRGC